MKGFPSARALAALALVTAFAGVVAAGAPTPAIAQTVGKTITTQSGLKITDTKIFSVRVTRAAAKLLYCLMAPIL